MASHKLKAHERIKKSPYRIEAFSQNKKVLIVCEGQTETKYFESFDVLSIKVVCEDSKGRTKLQLVEFCEKTEKNYNNKGFFFDEVWCVFDMDVKRKEAEFADFDNAIESAINKGYNVAYSNDAFELWFYLHFNYTDQQNLRGFYYQQLTDYFGYSYVRYGKKLEYCEKNYSLLMAHAQANQETAIRNAKKLHLSQEHLPYSQQNPVTTVYKLVTELNKYLRGTKHS